MFEGLEFHHVGVACRNLDVEETVFRGLGYRREGDDFVDPVQGVAGRFLTGAGPRLELLAPAADGGVLTPWLDRGAKLYHLAYLSRSIGADLERLKAARGRVMVGPVPATAFAGRAIAFVLLPNMLLIELIASAGESS